MNIYMAKVNPDITKKFLQEIKNQASEIIDIEGLKIKTCKDVFPPRSNFSRTSEKLHTIFGNLKGKRILDIGTGTGVQAIQAAKDGAQNVIALDINPVAVLCAKENIHLNGVEAVVSVFESDLFSSLKGEEKFDVVIANLPITDFPIKGIVESALYDPEYKIHHTFFEEVGKYLNDGGIIIMTHVNFKGESDFSEFEEMLGEYGYVPERHIEIEDIGYKWRMYRIIRSKLKVL